MSVLHTDRHRAGALEDWSVALEGGPGKWELGQAAVALLRPHPASWVVDLVAESAGLPHLEGLDPVDVVPVEHIVRVVVGEHNVTSDDVHAAQAQSPRGLLSKPPRGAGTGG